MQSLQSALLTAAEHAEQAEPDPARPVAGQGQELDKKNTAIGRNCSLRSPSIRSKELVLNQVLFRGPFLQWTPIVKLAWQGSSNTNRKTEPVEGN